MFSLTTLPLLSIILIIIGITLWITAIFTAKFSSNRNWRWSVHFFRFTYNSGSVCILIASLYNNLW